jgi:hypothetical protein
MPTEPSADPSMRDFGLLLWTSAPGVPMEAETAPLYPRHPYRNERSVLPTQDANFPNFHSFVIVFADKYDIGPLRNPALRKLHGGVLVRIQEINGCVYEDTEGFYEKYFEGRTWLSIVCASVPCPYCYTNT